MHRNESLLWQGIRVKITMQDSFNMAPVAVIHSPYKEKFAIPRQPNLVSAAHGKIELLLDCNQSELIRDLEQHSHLWLLFVFHGTIERGWKPLVKAPRLGGNKKTGVFATRSTHRPNPIGMSVVKLEGISRINDNLAIDISGLDLLDGTPIIDIKPYIPYSDVVVDASSQMAPDAQSSSLTIGFSDSALQQLAPLTTQYPQLQTFIEQVLSQDPRPAYRKKSNDMQEYGMSLYDLNIRWQIQGNDCTVLSISQ
ncbi:tRNA (N6-threonylcarbamoyladenosine(37)-N6)-methyltransferase TrmO [Thalassotalea sp. HSM 43]|uniref:tRNA (N6-threonylcarbamoyladenosine(37)-N6)-methyltransferase TrmO n=1 Tax=Thalassotalea sp. HSM 43 TaxID=2552945 RepID=UPI001E287BF4|nr:tRNA (N6-threonylcarbamoyladenosine(37)-N6)-methyltransferase TrmO [Thalassotalea sp. HSM 43]